MTTLLDELERATSAAKVVQIGQTASMHASASMTGGVFGLPDHWPAQGELLYSLQSLGPGLAALMVLMGVIYLLFGFNIFKYLVVVNAAVIGGAVGAAIGEHTGGALPLAITCAFVLAVVTWPMMKWAVAIFGGICGAAIGVSLWHTCNLDPQFAWSGAGMGLIFFTMLSFVLFKSSVMTFMSLQGAAMLIFGVLALIFKYDGLSPQVAHWFHLKPFLLPMMVFIPTVLGVVYQQKTAIAPAPASPPAKK